jgi:phage gpG-like protein
MTITVETVGVEEVNRLVGTLPQWAYKGVRQALSDYVFDVDRKMKQSLTGIDLNVRTGALRRSFGVTVSGSNLNDLSASNYTDSKYAPIHQYGGTIRAKNKYLRVPGGPYLNIPSNNNQTPSGVTRMSAGQVFAAGGHIVKINAPRARYMVMLQGVAMYWLVKSVDIPKRMKFEETSEAGIPTLLTNMMDAAFAEGRTI